MEDGWRGSGEVSHGGKVREGRVGGGRLAGVWRGVTRREGEGRQGGRETQRRSERVGCGIYRIRSVWFDDEEMRANDAGSEA